MVGIMFSLWVSNPLSKVFPDTPMPRGAPKKIVIWCARNEFESAQIAVRTSSALSGVTVQVSDLTHENDQSVLTSECVTWNFVGFIRLKKNTPHTPLEALVRKAPCDVPDVLLPDRARDIPAKRTQPIWLTFFVPKDARPGRYRGSVKVIVGPHHRSVPIELNVWPFMLPNKRHLFVTNWFSTGNIARAHKVKEWSEEFWAMLEKYFRNMAVHRQNVAWVPWSLIKVWREPDGKLSFDYSLFDRYVELMQKCGVADRIEIQHVARFGQGWGGRTIVFRKLTVTDRKTGHRVALGFGQGLSKLLADLQRHLQERGWLRRAMIHIADEPSANNVASWREKSRLVHQTAPRLRRIDAIEASDFGDDLDVWVPKLSHLNVWFDDYKHAQARGAELWYYICCHPWGGRYPNRFLDYPLGKVRVLHWLNYAYGIQGYLHWGLNFWPADPFGVPRPNLPPGDTHVLYPGPDGPLSSLRWETQRDSLEDYEYLWLLTQKLATVKRRLGEAARDLDPAARARELSRRLVRGLADVTDDPQAIRATRRAIAEEIIAADQEPTVLFATRPPEHTKLVPGPIVVEVRGAVEPGATVKLNGTLHIEKNGRFTGLCFLSEQRDFVQLTATRNGKTKALTRQFSIAP